MLAIYILLIVGFNVAITSVLEPVSLLLLAASINNYFGLYEYLLGFYLKNSLTLSINLREYFAGLTPISFQPPTPSATVNTLSSP